MRIPDPKPSFGFSPAQIVQYQVGLKVQEIIAGIEGHGQPRH
jgi:hypothetical protein